MSYPTIHHTHIPHPFQEKSQKLRSRIYHLIWWFSVFLRSLFLFLLVILSLLPSFRATRIYILRNLPKLKITLMCTRRKRAASNGGGERKGRKTTDNDMNTLEFSRTGKVYEQKKKGAERETEKNSNFIFAFHSIYPHNTFDGCYLCWCIKL